MTHKELNILCSSYNYIISGPWITRVGPGVNYYLTVYSKKRRGNKAPRPQEYSAGSHSPTSSDLYNIRGGEPR